MSAAGAIRAMLRPVVGGGAGMRVADRFAAPLAGGGGLDGRQRAGGEPILVMRPRVTLVSDSLWRGVSLGRDHSLSG